MCTDVMMSLLVGADATTVLLAAPAMSFKLAMGLSPSFSTHLCVLP
jgi:hypothetical protein